MQWTLKTKKLVQDIETSSEGNPSNCRETEVEKPENDIKQ